MNALHRHLSTLESQSIHMLQYERLLLPLNQGVILPASTWMHTKYWDWPLEAFSKLQLLHCMLPRDCSFFFFLEKHEYQRTMKGWAGADQCPHTTLSRSGQLYWREKKSQISKGGTRTTQLHCTLRFTPQRWHGPLTLYRFHWNTGKYKICTYYEISMWGILKVGKQ